MSLIRQRSLKSSNRWEYRSLKDTRQRLYPSYRGEGLGYSRAKRRTQKITRGANKQQYRARPPIPNIWRFNLRHQFASGNRSHRCVRYKRMVYMCFWVEEFVDRVNG